jgi:HD-GYP domain-containing protein (c-di-GMP phosphodiesterase class II)
VGLPTRVDIFDVHGQLLLARGSTVYREDSAERLQQAGFKIVATTQGKGMRRHEPVFQRMEVLADTMTDMERVLLQDQGLPSFTFKAQALAQTLIACCDEDHHAALAQAYLDQHHPYSVLHHVLVGVVVAVLARSEGWSDADRISLVAAALSHDLGALALRQALGQAASLDEEQRTLVREHPDRGVQMLDGLGRARRVVAAGGAGSP